MAVIEAGSEADRRLREDLYIWLTTVDQSLQPHSSLVFFTWDGREALIYTTPDRPKVANVQAHPRVALNLNAEPDGSGVVTVAGTAQLRFDAATAEEYLHKYGELLEGFGLSHDQFTRQYSVEIRITPSRVRSW